MKAIKAHIFAERFRKLRAHCDVALGMRDSFANRIPPPEIIYWFYEPLTQIREACEDMQLQVSAIQTARLVDEVLPSHFGALPSWNPQQYDHAWEVIERPITQLEITIEDEMSARAYLYLRPEQVSLYEAVSPFGDDVGKAFPSSLQDIEEAAKCIALDRGTAGVFHLMRVVEVGLRALGKSLNNPALDPKRNPSWEAILKKCDDQLALPIKDRRDEWKQDDAFFSDATANLRAVKNAWRNPTLHIERTYDPERALEVFQSVKGFMRHLAGRLSE